VGYAGDMTRLESELEASEASSTLMSVGQRHEGGSHRWRIEAGKLASERGRDGDAG